jgi:hypothetical protein
MHDPSASLLVSQNRDTASVQARQWVGTNN